MMCVLTIICFQCCMSKAQERTTVEKIEWLTNYKTSPVKKYTRHVEEADEYASALDKAADKYKIDVDYLIVIAWSESVFRNLIGDNGRSHGEMQVGKQGRRACKCDMSIIESRIDCGACWLDMGRKWCGSLDKGLQAYVGGSCIARTARAARAFQNKKRYLRRLKKCQI